VHLDEHGVHDDGHVVGRAVIVFALPQDAEKMIMNRPRSR
jgi:hypothetical protein